MGDRITFVVMRSGGAGARQFAVPRFAIYAALISIVLLVAATAFLALWSRGLMLEARQAHSLRLEVLRLGQDNMKIRLLEDELQRITDAQSQFLEWAGLPPLEERVMTASHDEMGDGSLDEVMHGLAVDPEGVPNQMSDHREGWRWPLEGWISRGFGQGEASPLHLGVDIVSARGTPVLAASDGVVTFAGWDDELGNMVILQHPGGYTSTYGHNDALLVSSGQRVGEGDVIAKVGSTGHSSAPHLHFEIRFAESPLDPEEFLEGGREGS